jgi:hypothetical protein
LTHCEQITQQLARLFTCERRDFGTLVRTPFVRPDGDFVEVVVRDEASGTLITDLGETLRWLHSVGAAAPNPMRTESILGAHSAAFADGEIYVRPMAGEGLAAAVVRAAQACVDFGASVYSQRARPERLFEQEVKERIASLRVPFEDQTLVGASGMKWRVIQTGDVHTRFRLVRPLSSKQRPYAQTLAMMTRCMWEDLRDLRKHQETGYAEYITVLDDLMPGLWRAPEIKLMENAPSKVVFWSEAKDLDRALGA